MIKLFVRALVALALIGTAWAPASAQGVGGSISNPRPLTAQAIISALGYVPAREGTPTGILPGSQGGTGVANVDKTITLGGNLTTTNTLTLNLAGISNVSVPIGGTLLTTTGSGTGLSGIGLLASPLSQFAATTSAELAGVLSDETGSGAAVFAASPAFGGAPTFGSIATVITTVLSQPAAAVVTAVGGATDAYRYRYVACAAGCTAGGVQMSSPVLGPAPELLDSTHYLSMTPPVVPGVQYYLVYRESANAPLTPGLIATVAPGVEFRDEKIVANSPQLWPSVDSGSAGQALSGPLTIRRTTDSVYGLLQVGNDPGPWTFGDMPGMTTIQAVFTQKIGPYEGAVAIGGAQIVFRSPQGTISNPGPENTGVGQVGAENYIGGNVTAWKATTAYEQGGSGGAPTNMNQVCGRHQFKILIGTYGGIGASGGGLTVGCKMEDVAYQPPYDFAAASLTDGFGLRAYRVGYAKTPGNDNPAIFERAEMSWGTVTNAITAATWASNQITLTTTTAHDVAVGQPFQVIGATPALWNGTYFAVAGTTGSTLVAQLEANPGTIAVMGNASYSSTTLKVGPAQAGATLRPMLLTGASVSTGNAFTAGTTIGTAAPSGASAHPWKLGSIVTETCTLDTTITARVDINGTMKKLAVCQ